MTNFQDFKSSTIFECVESEKNIFGIFWSHLFWKIFLRGYPLIFFKICKNFGTPTIWMSNERGRWVDYGLVLDSLEFQNFRLFFSRGYPLFFQYFEHFRTHTIWESNERELSFDTHILWVLKCSKILKK